MIKLYIGLGLIAVLSAIGYGLYDHGVKVGTDRMTVKLAEAQAKIAKKEKQDVKEIIKWKEKRVIVYRDRIKKIKVAEDPTGCLDSTLSDIGLGGMLLRSNSDSTKSGNDNPGG